MYKKTLAAFVTGLIGWMTAVVTSPAAAVTAAEWVFLATVGAQSFGVYQITNRPDPHAGERGGIDIPSLLLGAAVLLLVLLVIGDVRVD